MGRSSRKSPRKPSPRTARTRSAPQKPVATRRRTPLTSVILEKLDHFRRKKPLPLRVFCEIHNIPYTAAHYHLNRSSAADRDRRNAKIVKIVKKMSKKTRVKFQSTRITASDVIEQLGEDAVGLGVRQVNRIIRAALPERPKRQRIRGKPNAENTPEQMRDMGMFQQRL